MPRQQLKIHIIEAPKAAPGNKICTRCHQEKPEAEFNYAGRGTGRRMSYCRECRAKEQKEQKRRRKL